MERDLYAAFAIHTHTKKSSKTLIVCSVENFIWVWRVRRGVPTFQFGPSGPRPVLTDLKIAGSSSAL